MVKYVINIDEDNLDNNDIYCTVANATSLEKVLEDIKKEIKGIKFTKPLMVKDYECHGYLEKSKQEIVNEVIEIIDRHMREFDKE